MPSPYEFATARGICINALVEIGAYDVGEAPDADSIAIALARLQMQLQAWQAERITIGLNNRVTYTLTSGTSSITLGTSGTPDLVTERPIYFTGINYIVPGTSPAVETPMGRMDDDAYMNLSIKQLPNNLPTQWYYNQTVPNGTLIFWPVVQQSVQLALYLYQPYLSGTETLTDDLVGPPGWSEAMLYALALRLLTPFRVSPTDVPLIPQLAAESFARMVRPNIDPGQLGIDQALVPSSGGYNIYNDSFAAPSGR